MASVLHLVAIRSDVNTLEKSTNRNVMKFTKEKCQILRLWRIKRKEQHMLEASYLESSFEEKDLVILVDIKLHVSQQCTLVAKNTGNILGSIRGSIVKRSKELMLSL